MAIKPGEFVLVAALCLLIVMTCAVAILVTFAIVLAHILMYFGL